MPPEASADESSSRHLEQRGEVHLLQLLRVLDVHARVSNRELPRARPAPDLRLQLPDRVVERIDALNQLQGHEAVHDPLCADVSTSQAPDPRQQPFVGPAEYQAIEIRSRDLAPEDLRRVGCPLDVGGEPGVRGTGTSAP
jgi:hypothetical protein